MRTESETVAEFEAWLQARRGRDLDIAENGGPDGVVRACSRLRDGAAALRALRRWRSERAKARMTARGAGAR